MGSIYGTSSRIQAIPSVGYLDSPSSTNAQTYTLRLDTGGATGYINSRDSGNLGSYSGIILMEVLA